MQTLSDIAVYLAKKQPELLNSMLEDTPIIRSMPVRAATHGFKNVYSEVTDIRGPQEVNRNDELPTVSISTDLKEVTLGKIGGVLPIPDDTAIACGGYAKYVNDRIPSIIREGAMRNEQHIYYNGFMASAIKHNQVLSGGGSTANKQYSMVAVHWDQASTVGLFNPNAVSNGKLFEQGFLNGGNKYKIAVRNADGSLSFPIGKEYYVQMEFGLQLAYERSVAAIVNIEPAQNVSDPDKIDGLPTPKMMTDMLSAVRATSGSTVIYCNPVIVDYMAAKYQLNKRTVSNGERTVSYELVEWRGIPLIGSYNVYDGTEDVIAVA